MPARLLSRALPLVSLLLASTLAGCGAEINRHGHVFMDIDVNQVQPGMSREQVTTFLGSPDTTSTIGGDDAYYYISTTQKTYAFLKPWEIDRKVVAVYFSGEGSVQQVAQYGLKDGIVVKYAKDETPARGKDLTFIEQIFGNISQRGLLKDQRQQGTPGIPTPGGMP
jgi:outer membrane protein assembly factor BamE (lipoprotein component of BamABCDE complex)